MEEMVHIEGLSRVAPFRLRLWFSDGTTGEWDFSKLKTAPGDLLRPFRNADYFRAGDVRAPISGLAERL